MIGHVFCQVLRVDVWYEVSTSNNSRTVWSIEQPNETPTYMPISLQPPAMASLAILQSINQNPWPSGFVGALRQMSLLWWPPIDACLLQRGAMMTSTDPSIPWCLPLRRLSSTVPCSMIMIFGSISWRQTWPNHNNLLTHYVSKAKLWIASIIVECLWRFSS